MKQAEFHLRVTVDLGRVPGWRGTTEDWERLALDTFQNQNKHGAAVSLVTIQEVTR